MLSFVVIHDSISQYHYWPALICDLFLNSEKSSEFQQVALPSQIAVPPESDGNLTLEFLPLTARVQSGKIELNNADLGQYTYELECTATAAGPEKALYFKCPLGSHQTLSAKFLNFAKQKTEYTCKVSVCVLWEVILKDWLASMGVILRFLRNFVRSTSQNLLILSLSL